MLKRFISRECGNCCLVRMNAGYVSEENETNEDIGDEMDIQVVSVGLILQSEDDVDERNGVGIELPCIKSRECYCDLKMNEYLNKCHVKGTRDILEAYSINFQ